jgi:uncharacterized NAD(P)/FAD-binding protein YdhS
MKMDQCIAIIGGGPTGIGVARELAGAGLAVQIYEAESDFGGVWNAGAACGRAYDSLHLISPKFNTQVADFPMPEDYPPYPNHRLMLRYIRDYAKANGLYERTHFNAPVRQLEPISGGWLLTAEGHAPRAFPLVIVCNGLQREPMIPATPPLAAFTGEILHSSAYKSGRQLAGKRVLVVGAGNSGCDIAVDAVHHADQVYHSTRRGYYYQPKFIDGKPTPQWMMELGNRFASKAETLAYIEEVFRLAGYDGAAFGLPAPDYPLDAAHPVMNSLILHHIGHGDVTPKPDVKAYEGGTVTFADGTEAEVDTVLFATGYRRDFPFLDSGLLQWKSGIPDLFLHSVPRNHDTLLFMGFINAAGGLGDGLKTQGLFSATYARALFERSPGLAAFNRAKAVDNPDLGQGYFVQSYRHLWEADLWKLLSQMRRYRDMLAGEAPARSIREAAQ